jgi:hypothetical protein
MLDAMLLQPTEIVAMTPCKTAFAAMARGMVLDVARAKPMAVRQAFALLDELEPRRPGQRRPRGIDQKLGDAEWADEDASWCDGEGDADSPISERFIEERLPGWSEIAQQHFRAEERSERLRDRAGRGAGAKGTPIPLFLSVLSKNRCKGGPKSRKKRPAVGGKQAG